MEASRKFAGFGQSDVDGHDLVLSLGRAHSERHQRRIGPDKQAGAQPGANAVPLETGKAQKMDLLESYGLALDEESSEVPGAKGPIA